MEGFLKQCQKNLIDTSARNNLVNFKFSSPTCFDVEKFLQSRKEGKRQAQSFEIEPIGKFKEEEDLSEKEKLQKQAHKTLGKIYLKQQEIKDEKGFNPTSWAYYFFKYKDNDKERFAPVYLITTEVVRNGKGGYSVGHFASGAIEVNFNRAIYEKFKSELDINIEKTLTSFEDKEISIDDIDQKISEINDFLAGNIHKVSIEKKIVIGVFNSAKASLYNELVDLEDEFSNHNLIKIFTSKENNELNQGELCEDAREIDKIPSNRFFSPFDFDSSQLQAIKAAKDGKNFIIQGPPGTGKTQTISNIISELVAEGKKVLFVAEKKAAIDAVLKNFSKIGLEKIFLDLHDKKSKSKDIVAQVIDSIDFFRYENYSSRNSDDYLERLDQNKRDISKRSELLHQELSFGKKPFDLIFELSQMEDVEKIDCDFFVQSSKENFDLCLKVLERVAELSDIYLDANNIFLENDLEKLKNFLKNDVDQNSIANFQLSIQGKKSLESSREELSKIFENLKNQLDELNFNVEKFNKIEDLKNILELFTKYLSLGEDLNRAIQDRIKNFEIAKKAKNFFLKKKINKSIKQTYLKIENHKLTEALQNIVSGKIDINSLGVLVENYFKNKDELDSTKEELEKTICNLKTLHELISSYLNISHKFEETDLNNLEQEIYLYAKYLPSLQKSISYLELKKEFRMLSAIDFWNQCLANNISPRKILKTFKKSFYSKVVENLTIKNELISNTKLTSKIVDDFKTLDKNLIHINKNRIIKNIKNRSLKTVQDIEFQELKYRQRFPKPRKIISKYRDIIVNSIGCVVCSPLTICQYFEVDKNDAKNPIFDVVIFDEASQIFTWDALSSIFRAKQMIIAGDTEQMPPTNLFASNDNGDFDEEDEGDERAGDYEGLLSYTAVRLKEVNLQWHYRSKFEQLIHPSNQFVYNGRLITFPNANKNEKPVVFHYLPEGIWEKQTNDSEAKYLIKLLKEIYQAGTRSVGVIAINQRQQTLIRDLIYCNEELTSWLDSEDQDGLFVKNLENCQGDERDIIIVCSSYAKNKDGKIDGRMFSQINKDNAYKRLNVMFSRAKQKLHLLSSLKWQDISSDYEGKKGMKFFKNYLRFAETGDFGISAQSHTKQDGFDSGFEESVCKSLRILGYQIDSQVGYSGYKIDLAIICPNTKNYILGIECDGEMYHSGRTARERDRLRQEVLEGKGWKIHRIWSYDWIHSKNEELENLKNKIDQLKIW